MIGRLTGRLIGRSPDRILLDVSGVGYEIRIPLSTFYRIGAPNDPAPVTLHIHTHVREDALQLFGFSTLPERESFQHLISISGVGPRIALAFLSGIGVDELREAVVRGHRERLQRIPGVGKKTAERVLLELRDKLDVPERPDASSPAPPAAAGAGAPTVETDAVSALVNLGYGRGVAEKAIERALREGPAAGEDPTPSLEAVLKQALRGLVR